MTTQQAIEASKSKKEEKKIIKDIRDDVERNPLNYFLIKSLSEELVYVLLTSIVHFTNIQESKTMNRQRQTVKLMERLKDRDTLATSKFRSSTFKHNEPYVDNDIIEENENESPHFANM
jgi:hypothetical protein